MEKRTIQCDGEEWQVTLRERTTAGWSSKEGYYPNANIPRWILNFSRVAASYEVGVEIRSLDDLTDEELCKRLADRRSG